MILSKVLVWVAVILYLEYWTAANGKSATRSSLVASTSRLAGSSNQNKGPSGPLLYSSPGEGANLTPRNLTPLHQLRNYLMDGYDNSLPPVLDYTTSVKIKLDVIYKQVLDLDEKNQILKSLIWYRQYWTDQNLIWTPADFDGIKEITLPATTLWQPDIAIYEEVGSKDYTPRLPFATVQSNGNVMYAEPTVLETSCSVNTAFFPFDTQMCHFTYVSWTQPLTHIDIHSKRNTESIQKDIDDYIDTGEWVLQKLRVHKQVVRYNSDLEENVTLVGPLITHVPETQITEPGDIEGNASSLLYTELRYSIVIRRNSGLYMQSMLFPSILLTTVATFGFYLPPDSGERVGLQITILLTFMVFLLTVGEMFPASTGPYIGLYFVLSMGQLGVNILMTIVVLHLHFKPCERDIAVWRARLKAGGEPDSMIPVRLRKFLQFCDRHFSIADKGVSWMKPIRSTPSSLQSSRKPSEPVQEQSEEKIVVYGSDLESPTIEMRKGSASSGILTPIAEDEQCAVEIVPPRKTSMLNEERKNSTPNRLSVEQISTPRKKDKSPKTPRRDSELQKVMESFRSTMKGIVGDGLKGKMEKDEEEEMEESVEREQEEWKSVARAVDKLFFRLYVFIMFVTFIAIAVVTVNGTITLNTKHSEWE